MSHFGQQDVHWSPVLLTGSSTWDVWYALIKNTATVQGIGQYVNPDTPTNQLPALPEPLATVLPERVEDEQNPIDLYWLRYQVYQTAMEQYKAVQQFMLRILESLSTDVLTLTLRSTSAHAMLVVFKERYALSNKSQKAELLQRYRHLQKPPSNKDVEVRLDEWLTVYHDAHVLQLPDVADERATVNFLQAIESLQLKFHTYWTEKVEDTGDYPSLQEIIVKF
jgi:hypothetical protein